MVNRHFIGHVHIMCNEKIVMHYTYTIQSIYVCAGAIAYEIRYTSFFFLPYVAVTLNVPNSKCVNMLFRIFSIFSKLTFSYDL